MFALLQTELTPGINRQILEDASAAAPRVGRADCFQLARNAFGIIARDLPLEEARALHTALAARGLTTEIVPGSRLPLPVTAVARRGVRLHDHQFEAIDGLGRGQAHAWSAVTFATGGLVSLKKDIPEQKLERSPAYSRRSRSGHLQLRGRHSSIDEKTEQFFLEFHLTEFPYRLRFEPDNDGLFWMDDVRLSLRQPAPIVDLLQGISRRLPPSVLSTGLATASHGALFTYPSPAAIENELSWNLFQRLR